MCKLFKKKEKPLKIIIGFHDKKPIVVSSIKLKILILAVLSMGLTSCSTIDSLYENTTVTYNVKKGTMSAKTKVNKHLIIKL